MNRYIAEALKRLKSQKEKNMTRLENELIKTIIEGDENVRIYRQYEVRYKIVEEKEIVELRKFIRFYTERISLKKPAQRYSFSELDGKTDLQLVHDRKQNTQLYMKSNSENVIYC